MEDNHVRVEYEVKASVAYVTLCHAERMNALTYSMLDELGRVVGEAERDESVRCLVLRGEGEVFSAGGDLGPN